MTTPGGEVIGEARIQVDADTDPASRALREFSRDAQGRLRDVRGRFVTEGQTINRSLGQTGEETDRLGQRLQGLGDRLEELGKRSRASFRDLKVALISLAPTAIPVAASLTAALVPIVEAASSAAVAVAAFGAAIVPQIQTLSDAATAETKYQKAVALHGKFSKQAQTAELEYQAALEKMPAATKRASAAFSVLRDSFTKWSDSLASTTLPQFTKSFEIAAALLPKFTPLVKGAAGQLDRLTTALAGAVAAPGFDGLVNRFETFANQSLKKVVDGVIHFSRVLSTGMTPELVTAFFQYAKENGPLVRKALTNIGDAIVNVLEAASQAGLGLLAVVNGFAHILASIPPSLLARLLQVYTAFKLIRLAGAGFGVVARGLATMVTQLAALRVAALGAGGGMAGLRAAFLSLGTAAKASVIVAGIAAVAVVLTKLSEIGKKAPPDVDKMATAIGNLGLTGKVSGEALRSYGEDLKGLADSINTLANPSNAEKVQQFLVGLIGMDSTPVADAKKDVEAFDKALASLVASGNADLANAAFQRAVEATGKAGHSTKDLKDQLDSYKSALADAAFEQKLAAESMGLFGQQAIDVQKKLDAQKQSADGLRQSIQALNDVNRQGIDGMIGFEAAIDAASKAAKDNAGALSISHGQLDLNSEKARTAAQALNDLAAKTDAAATSARENGSSWSTVNRIYDRGRSKLIASAQAMGLTREQAKRLADQILKTPDKTAKLRGNMEDLQAKLNSAKRQLKSVPDSRKARVQATIDQLQAQIRRAKAALAGIGDKTVLFRGVFAPTSADRDANGIPDTIQRRATGGLVGGVGSGTSDSNLVRVSRGEYVVRAAAVNRYGVGMLDQLNALQLRNGGLVTPLTQVSPGGASSSTINVTLVNHGVIASKNEALDWLQSSMETLRRQRRLPRAAA